MSYEITNMWVDPSMYYCKCPYEMTPTRVVVHNTANDASARNEVTYMRRNTNYTSFHVAIDDVEAVQAIPFNRNAFHAGDGGDGVGNRQGIGIEICYSLSGGSKFDQAEKNAAEYIAGVLEQYGWGIDKVTKHQDYMNKYCPHRTLDYGWDRFLDMIKSFMGKETPSVEEPVQTVKADQILKAGSKVKLDGVFRCDYIDISRNLVASSALSNGSPSDYNWLDATPLYKCSSDGSNQDINGVIDVGDYFMCPDVCTVTEITYPNSNEPNGTCSFALGNREVNCLSDRILEVSDN